MQSSISVITEMDAGQIARCDFCNMYETNSKQKMREHMNAMHYAMSDVNDIASYVTLTGKTAPVDEVLTVGQTLSLLQQCRLGRYDMKFISSISSQYFQWGRLTDKQTLAIQKCAHKYRKQIAYITSAQELTEAKNMLAEVRRWASFYRRNYINWIENGMPMMGEDQTGMEHCESVIVGAGKRYCQHVLKAQKVRRSVA